MSVWMRKDEDENNISPSSLANYEIQVRIRTGKDIYEPREIMQLAHAFSRSDAAFSAFRELIDPRNDDLRELAAKEAFKQYEHEPTPHEIGHLKQKLKEFLEEFFKIAWPKNAFKTINNEYYIKISEDVLTTCRFDLKICENILKSAEEIKDKQTITEELHQITQHPIFNKDLPTTIHTHVFDSRDPLATIEGILWLDYKAAKFITSIGKKGKYLGDDIREKGKQRYNEYVNKHDANIGEAIYQLHQLWLPYHSSPSDKPYPTFSVTLAYVLWEDVVKQEIESELKVRPLIIQNHAKLPKLTPGLSWAFGAPAIETKVDEDTYATTPNLARNILVPRTMSLLPVSDKIRPHQISLPISFETEEEGLAISVANATMYAITTQGAKIALACLSSPDVQKGQLVRSTAKELAMLISPTTKRIRQRELEAITIGIANLRRLFIYLPDGTRVQVFSIRDVADPKKVKTDTVFVYGLDRTFIDAISDCIKGKKHNDPYNGTFVMNMSGAMRIPNNHAGALRLLVRACAAWNASYLGRNGTYDPKRLPYKSIDYHATLANTYPPGVVEYLKAQGSQRAALSNRRVEHSQHKKKVIDDFELLASEDLVIIEKSGNDYRLAPPKSYIEAWEQIRKTGQQNI